MPDQSLYVYLPIELAVLVAALLASRWQFWQRTAASLEAFFQPLSRRPLRAFLAMAGTALLIRLSLLWLAPVPIPLYHDEFSFLLGADTFAHGRLTNPTPLVAKAFETIHVNMWPTYESMYMPGNALLLTLGHLAGLPWLSVLLITSLFCGAVYWMVSGWLPRSYGLATAVAAVALTQSMNGWWDKYFCIGLPAMGGLLVLGSLPRVLSRRTHTATLPLAAGLIFLILTRPYEGFCVCFPAVVVLLWQLGRRAGWVKALFLSLVPVILLSLTFAWVLFYDWRGTGHATLAPYMLNYRDYHISGAFLFSPNQPIPQYHLDIMRRFYMGAELPQYAFAHQHPIAFLVRKVTVYYFAYVLGFGLLVAAGIFYLSRHLREPLLAAPLAALGGFTLQVVLAAWAPFPQYGAPAAGLLLLLISFGIYWLRHTQIWRFDGISVTRGLVLAELALSISVFGYHVSEMHDLPEPQYVSKDRANVAHQVLSHPGKQLVLVRYTPGHDGWQEWVFNGADLANERLLWARSLDPATDAAVISAYPGREVWLAKPDYADDLLRPYEPWTTFPLPEYVPKDHRR